MLSPQCEYQVGAANLNLPSQGKEKILCQPGLGRSFGQCIHIEVIREIASFHS